MVEVLIQVQKKMDMYGVNTMWQLSVGQVYKVDLKELIKKGILSVPIFEECKTSIKLGDGIGIKALKNIQQIDNLPDDIANIWSCFIRYSSSLRLKILFLTPYNIQQTICSSEYFGVSIK